MIRLAFITDASRVIGSSASLGGEAGFSDLPPEVVKKLYNSEYVVVAASSLGPWASSAGSAREVFVLSHEPIELDADHLTHETNPDDLIKRFAESDEELLVVGGKALLELFLPHARRVDVAETFDAIPGNEIFDGWDDGSLVLDDEDAWADRRGRTLHYLRPESLDRFNARWAQRWILPVCTFLAIGVWWILIKHFNLDEPAANLPEGCAGRHWRGVGAQPNPAHLHVFVVYLGMFSAMWLAYFASGRLPDSRYFRMRTLRCLLRGRSHNWASGPKKDIEKIQDENEIKAGQTMTMLSVLAATAALILTAGNDILLSYLNQPCFPHWRSLHFAIGLSMASTFAALLCFLVSVDGLDTIFNSYSDNAGILKSHFYKMTINPKYAGFALLLFGAVGVLFVLSIDLACLALACVLVVGYPHWFPYVKLPGSRTGQPWYWSKTLRYLLLVPPLALLAGGEDLGRTLIVSASEVVSSITSYRGEVLALLAALAWAVSSVVLKRATQRIPHDRAARSILLGLATAILVGASGLAVVVFLRDASMLQPIVEKPLLLVVGAGVMTFPIATGLYYLSGYALGSRFDIASQAANVKPLFSILAGVFLLKEGMTSLGWVAVGFIALGVAAFIHQGLRGHFEWRGLGLGLLTAIAWTLGELFISAGGSDRTLPDSFHALVLGGVPVALVIVFIVFFRSGKDGMKASFSVLPGFAVHGLLSFAFAYTCFFSAIREIGLSKAAFIIAWWPALSMVLIYWDRASRGEPLKRSKWSEAAVALLLLGTLTYVFSLR